VFPIKWPRVPGHEAVVGSMRSVKASKVGQSASVSAWGFSAAAADTASLPRRRPRELSEPGLHRVQEDGGYAEVMIARPAAHVGAG